MPALPDAERRTSYSISASLCTCAVGFQLYGDSTDVGNWIEVYVNGIRLAQAGNWGLTSPSGSLATLPRPITDAVLTFTAAQTGTIQIVGARRPRRTSQFQESAGVSARNLNQTFSDVIATMRETWDRTNDLTGRAILAQPGYSVGPLPAPSSCINSVLGFDATGLNPFCFVQAVGGGGTTINAVGGAITLGAGLTISGQELAANGTAITAASVAALKAFDTTKTTLAYLTGTRGGTFALTLGNFTNQIAADTNNGVYIKPNAVAANVAAWVRQFDGTHYSGAWFGVVTDGATDNTAILNTALTVMSLTSPGSSAYLDVPRNAQFASANLNWNSNANQTYAYLTYFMNSDTTQGNSPFGTAGTFERRTLSVNSGFPGVGSGAFIGENFFSGPINPAIGVVLQKNLNSTVNSYLNGGQVLQPTPTLSVRATPVFAQDEGFNRWYCTYSTYAALSAINGTLCQTVHLDQFVGGAAGFNNATSWGAHIPAVGSILRNTTGTARMLVQTFGTTISMTGPWLSGTFAPGDTMLNEVALFKASISGTVMTVTAAAGAGGPGDPTATWGVLAVGHTISGPGITAGTVISSLGTGTGGIGTYNINNSQSFTSNFLTSGWVGSVQISGGGASQTPLTYPPLIFGHDSPALGFDVGPGNLHSAFGVGGGIEAQRSNALNGVAKETVTDPYFRWAQGASDATACQDIYWETVSAKAARVLQTRSDCNQTDSKSGWVGAISLSVRVNNAGIVSSAASTYPKGLTFLRNSAGNYTLTFPVAHVTAEMRCVYSADAAAPEVTQTNALATGSLNFVNYAMTVSGAAIVKTLTNLAGNVDVICTGGKT